MQEVEKTFIDRGEQPTEGVRNLCSPSGGHPCMNVLVNVERETLPHMAADVLSLGSWRQMSSRSTLSDGPRKVYCEGRLCVRRFDHFLPERLDEPLTDRQGHWMQTWPYYISLDGKKVCQ